MTVIKLFLFPLASLPEHPQILLSREQSRQVKKGKIHQQLYEISVCLINFVLFFPVYYKIRDLVKFVTEKEKPWLEHVTFRNFMSKTSGRSSGDYPPAPAEEIVILLLQATNLVTKREGA